MLQLRPITVKAASRWMAARHRHNRPPQGGLFAVSCETSGELVGVAIVARPVARMAQDGWTCEVTRLCTDGTPNACSLLYGACARAAKALGYRSIITYTLAEEGGASLRASGWTREAELRPRPTWSCPARDRVQVDLFGDATRPAGAKVRWRRTLAEPAPLLDAHATPSAASRILKHT